MSEFDVVVIGSGPGGYICAIRAAQLGLKTAIIEKESTLGGVCLNVGCIPSKALLESSYLYHKSKTEMAQHGIQIPEVHLQLKTLLERKDKVVQTLTGGVAGLMKKNKVQVFKGLGRIAGPQSVLVEGPDAGELNTKTIVLATGSVPSSLPGVQIDEKRVVSSTGALNFPEVPKKLFVIGGGYIGLEMGSVWSRLGAEVEVIEFMDKIIPNMDESLSASLQKILEKQGLKFRLRTAVQSVEVKGSTVQLKIQSGDKSETLTGDYCLVSVGRKPYTDGLGLEKLGITTDKRGFIPVDANYRTSSPSVYAIGDVIGGLMLAHKAEEEGVACAEIIHGEKPKINYNLVPGILYTHPEVASVGKTEQELRAAAVPYKKGQFSLRANGRAISVAETEGFVKILAHEKTDEILGAHIIAPNASEMIHEVCVAMEFAATATDLGMTMHGHPTLSEAVKEAALAVHGHQLNS